MPLPWSSRTYSCPKRRQRAGSSFEVAVVVDIASGYHMNSHKPLDEFLIPTTLTPQAPGGPETG